MLTQEIKKKIDSARDILVGKVPDPKAQVEQITTALIYKFMDDMDKASGVFGGKSRFFSNGFEKYAWSKLMDPKLGGQERLELYGEAIMKMSQNPHIPQLFRDFFKDAFLPYRSPETLNLFLKEINGFEYDHSENLGNAFEYMLSIMGSQGDAGQFRTPRHIIDFIVDVIDPKKDETILDPACGTAGFLISAYKHIINQHDCRDNKTGELTNAEQSLTPDEKKKLTGNLVGYDISPDMVKLSKVNMYLHGFADPKIYEYDTLSSEERWDEFYDVIMANPPFMSPKGGIRPHKRFSVQANRSEVLFVDYIKEHLRPDGRAGIIVPDGVINTSGRTYNSLRKELVGGGLWAIVDLPAGIFQPYSKVKTSILFIDKSIKSRNIYFLKVETIQVNTSYEISQSMPINIGLVTDKLIDIKKAISLNSQEIENALDIKFKSKETILNSKNAFLKQEYYFDNTGPQQIWGMVPLSSILEKSGEKVGKRKNIPVMSITMNNGLIDQSKKFKKRIANIDISKYKLVKRDELVVGFPIDEGVLGFQTKYDYAAVSPAYDVWRVKRSDIPIIYLEYILRSPVAINLYKNSMKGTANRRRVVPKEIFLSLKIPIYENIVGKTSKQIEDINFQNKKLEKHILNNNEEIKQKVAELWGDNK